jgi:hypothetical protein
VEKTCFLKIDLGENAGFCEMVDLFEQVKGKQDKCPRLSSSQKMIPRKDTIHRLINTFPYFSWVPVDAGALSCKRF